MNAAFRQAEERDFDAVTALFLNAIAHMRENGIDQWDELYPTSDILREDIENGEMYLLVRGEDIFSAVVINARQDEEYAQGDWRCGSNPAVIHRLCVHPKYQHQGVAAETVRRAERLISGRGYDCVRLDTFTRNPYAMKLYKRLGYQKAGEIRFRKGLFALMEKALTPAGEDTDEDQSNRTV
jgi:ribosomal protein S18 acetylase RimI-like enzyme